MRTRNFILLAIVAATGAALAGDWAARRDSGQPEPAPTAEPRANLVIGSDSLNFGEVWESDQFVWTVPVTNQEPVPVEVSHFSATCNCLSIEPQSFVLGSGERRDLRLQLDLVTKPPPDGEVAVRLTAKLKEETSGGKRLGPDWVVRGRVRRAISLEQDVIYLGRHSELSQASLAKTVPVKALAPLGSLSAQSDIPGLAASVLPPTAGSSTYSLTLTPTKPLPRGAITRKVLLGAVSRSGELLPPRRVEVRADVVPDLEVQPNTMQVGGRRVGEMFEEVVTLRSLTGRSVGTIQVETEGDGLTVKPTALANEFRVRQIIRRTGFQSTQVHFRADLAGQRITTVLPVEYTGLAAE